jgi:hypothetical protein
MATSKTTTPALPAAWGTDAEELETRILTDKDDLVGTPMKILGFEIERNEKRGYDVAFVYALDENGTEFCFADTSDTGIRGQLQKSALAKGLNPAANAGYQKLPLIAMGGLRVSVFEAVDEKTGKAREAKTFYLEGKAKTHS